MVDIAVYTQLSSRPFHAFDFTQFKPEDFIDALNLALSKAKERIAAYLQDSREDFESVVLRFEDLSYEVERVSAVYQQFHSCLNDEQVQAIGPQIAQLLSAFSHDLYNNEKIFARIDRFYQQRETYFLKEQREDRYLLEKIYLAFQRSGAALSLEKKEQLKAIDAQLAAQTTTYGNRVLGATQAYEYWPSSIDELSGLSERSMALLKQLADQRRGKSNQTGDWVLTLDAPCYMAVMKECSHRATRERMYLAYQSRATDGAHSNLGLIKEIAQLRAQRAELFGEAHHAAFVLKERCAKSLEQVDQFLEQLHQVALPGAHREMAALQSLAKEQGIETLARWDVAYYMERLKEKTLGISDAQLRPYFELQSVLGGLFHLIEKLLGLKFKPLSAQEVSPYHPDVAVYQVTDSRNLDKEGREQPMALLYLDLYNRPTKGPGAWMSTLLEQGLHAGKMVRPQVVLVCNFAKVALQQSQLLSWEEVITLYHEFGHGLHAMVSKCHYPRLSGTNVLWDFVELPSQFMENWPKSPQVLKQFAKHYETGEVIPDHLIEKLNQSDRFMASYQLLRQVGLSRLDMHYHRWSAEQLKQQLQDPYTFERQVMSSTSLLASPSSDLVSASFGHIFSGGYSSGYYSYKWAEVLEADACAYFEERGLDNPEVAKAWRKLLEQGGSVDPMELYQQFRGRAPKTEALYRKLA